MKEIISSSQNRQVKHVKSLHAKKHRDNLQQYIIEGYKLVEEALAYHKPFYMLLFSESASSSNEGSSLYSKCLSLQLPVFIAEDKIFIEASEMDAPQGVIAVLNKQEQDLNQVLDRRAFRIMILDEVRDPGNVGTIIRTADACAIDAVVLSKGCVDLYNGKTLRATMGSMFHIPVITDVEISDLIENLKQLGAEVYGADPHSDISCIDIEAGNRIAIVIGNEAKGLRDDIKAITNKNITIPMPGKAESLNASIAAAILMYEFAVRKK